VSERRVQVESALKAWADRHPGGPLVRAEQWLDLVIVMTALLDTAVAQDRRRILAKFDALVAVMFGLEDK
jgi:hypothetical protein